MDNSHVVVERQKRQESAPAASYILFAVPLQDEVPGFPLNPGRIQCLFYGEMCILYEVSY